MIYLQQQKKKVSIKCRRKSNPGFHSPDYWLALPEFSVCWPWLNPAESEDTSPESEHTRHCYFTPRYFARLVTSCSEGKSYHSNTPQGEVSALTKTKLVLDLVEQLHDMSCNIKEPKHVTTSQSQALQAHRHHHTHKALNTHTHTRTTTS